MKLGAHQSIAGGLHMAPQRALAIGLDCFQMFTKAPQSWHEPDLTGVQIEKFKTACIRGNYLHGHVAVHASYLVNVCSANELTRHRAIDALVRDARRCDALEVAYLVFHPGSPGKMGADTGISLVATAIAEVLRRTQKVTILIENTAGTGQSIGHTFEQIADIIHRAGNHHRIGVCFDTAHALAAGYSISTPADAQSVFDDFNRVIGMARLQWIHLNDSRTGRGSRVDRHETIGKGKIGTPFFKWLVNAPFVKNISATLETPLEKNCTYEKDVNALRKMQSRASGFQSERK